MTADKIVQSLTADGSALCRLKRDDLIAMAKNMPIMAWVSESDAPANWFNAEWLDFVGRTEKIIQNWAYQDFHHPDYMAKIVSRRFEATRAGKIWEDTFPLLGRDKKFHWLRSRAIPIFDQDGNLTCYFGFHIDVTDKIATPKLRPAKW